MEIDSLLVACRSLLGRKKRQCHWEAQPKQSFPSPLWGEGRGEGEYQNV